MKYDITDFGARRGEDAPQTGAIQAAIDACFLAGGGEVVVPEGTFLTGGIRLRTGVTLHLLKNARLLGTRNPADYFGYLQDEIEPMPPAPPARKTTGTPGLSPYAAAHGTTR